MPRHSAAAQSSGKLSKPVVLPEACSEVAREKRALGLPQPYGPRRGHSISNHESQPSLKPAGYTMANSVNGPDS